MTKSSTLSLEDLDFDFENASTRIIALENLREIKIAGVTIGPLKEGKETETKNWIASELVKAGYARFHDEHLLNIVSLNKIHWRETRLQTGRRISSLPEFFYPRLRRYLMELKDKAVNDASHAIEYDRAVRLAYDIVNCRLKKIVSLSASPSQMENVLRSLSIEERILYDVIHSKVLNWNSNILKVKPSK